MSPKIFHLSTPAIPKKLESLANLSKTIDSEDGIENVKVENESLHQRILDTFSITDALVIKTDFSGTEISGFGIKNAVISDSVMTAAKFPDASWHITELHTSRCSGMQLDNGHLKDVLFKNCKLDLVNFRFAKLTNVIFDSCVITEMDFYNAELKNVAFINCEIDKVEFSRSKLQNVDLTEAQIVAVKGPSHLRGAIINNEQLVYLAPSLAVEFGIKVAE